MGVEGKVAVRVLAMVLARERLLVRLLAIVGVGCKVAVRVDGDSVSPGDSSRWTHLRVLSMVCVGKIE